VLAWAVVAYLFAPRLWRVYYRYRPSVAEVARVTRTADHHPGDPVNIALVGSDTDVVRAMTAAGWYPADPITFRTSMRIIAASVLRRPDDDAPVSNLFLFDRKQDLPSSRPSAASRRPPSLPALDKMYDGRATWIGAATFDVRVGFSHDRTSASHRPGCRCGTRPVAAELENPGLVQSIEWTDGFRARLEGRNGGDAGVRWPSGDVTMRVPRWAASPVVLGLTRRQSDPASHRPGAATATTSIRDRCRHVVREGGLVASPDVSQVP
jgi:hypothetical protein